MPDSIITPENTKLIAKWMRHEVTVGNTDVFDGIVLVWNKHLTRIIYNPITNADQRFEILEKLLSLGWKISKRKDSFFIRLQLNRRCITETIKLAIYTAALHEAKKTKKQKKQRPPQKVKIMNNEIVTPKNTKLIAEWMGWDRLYIDSQHRVTGFDPKAHINLIRIEIFSPITNADQRFEILEKLLLSYGAIIQRHDDKISINLLNYTTFIAETLPLAIYKAALYEAKK